MKKKIFSIVMALCLILTFMPTMAFADGEATLAPTLTVTPSNVNVGDTVTVKINSQAMPNNTNQYATLEVDLTYDTTAFDVVSNSHTKTLTIGGNTANAVFNQNNSGKASWAFDFAATAVNEFPACELTISFTAKKAGSAQFSVTKFDLADIWTSTYTHTLPAAQSVTVARGPVTETAATDVILAPLVDKASSNPVSEEVLNAAVSLSAVTNGEATLTYKQLKKHENGNHVEGYWVGVGVEIPTMATGDKLFYRLGSTGTWTELDVAAEKYTKDGKDYICFYADATKKSALDIDLAAAATAEGIASCTCAKVNFVEAIAHPEAVIKAPLVDHGTTESTTGSTTGTTTGEEGLTVASVTATEELYTSYDISYAADTGIAAITAKDLKAHKNAAGTSGKWIGVGVPVTDGATTVYYGYGDTKPTTWNSVAVAGEKYTEDGKDYICFYQDAATEPSRTIWYAFDDTDVYYQVIVNGTLTTTPTGGAVGGNSYAQKPTIVADETKGDVTLSSDGRTATITPKDGYEIDNVTVNGVDKGAVDILTGLKTGDKVEVTYKAKASAFNLANYLADLKLVARSAKTAKGNVKVTVTSVTDGNGNAVDLSELKAKGYTVEYKFYRSVKKASKYKVALSKPLTDNTYTNTTGEKGTKYYYKARVVVKDGNGLVVGQTELKQCKYACRTWTK